MRNTTKQLKTSLFPLKYLCIWFYVTFFLYRWDCNQSISSMYRNEYTDSCHLLRTRHDAHASSEGRRVIPHWERFTPRGCIPQYSRNYPGCKGRNCSLTCSYNSIKSTSSMYLYFLHMYIYIFFKIREVTYTSYRSMIN